MHDRREEILAKKAKLAELKRQRELRASQVTATRQSIGTTSSDVGHFAHVNVEYAQALTGSSSSYPLRLAALIANRLSC